ncbi:MAG: DUF302 domain-containing protein, partial [Candidatus Scalindua sp.]
CIASHFEVHCKKTLLKKLHVDFKQYKILGTCNPPFSRKLLEAENKIESDASLQCYRSAT